jgi:hypothetical protein
LLACALPFAVYAYEAPRSREVAWLAAVACTLAPLTNVLATSAQPETLFTLALFSATWALDRKRFAVAGALLLVASLLRYEAWGAVVAVAVLGASSGAWRRALVTAAIPSAGIVAWIVLRRAIDGRWLAFVPQTHDFVARYSAETGSPAWHALLLPLVACGPALPFAALGMRRAWRPSFAVFAGLSAFLIVAFAGGSAIALPRYLTALTPFLAIAMAEGARDRPARTAMLASLVATTAVVALHAAHQASLMR